MSYPLPNFHFQVEMDGIQTNASKVRNLAMHIELIDSARGDSPALSDEKQPGRPVFENFFLERAVKNKNNEFFEWWESTRLFNEGGNKGSVFRRTMVIKLLNDEHNPVVVWTIVNAIPVRLSYSDLDAQGNSVLIETLEVACERIEVENK